MKLVIENVKVLARLVTDQKAEPAAEILYLGGRAFVANPGKIASGDYASVSIDVDLQVDARKWESKDGRSGAMTAHAVRFGALREATPLKR